MFTVVEIETNVVVQPLLPLPPASYKTAEAIDGFLAKKKAELQREAFRMPLLAAVTCVHVVNMEGEPATVTLAAFCEELQKIVAHNQDMWSVAGIDIRNTMRIVAADAMRNGMQVPNCYWRGGGIDGPNALFDPLRLLLPNESQRDAISLDDVFGQFGLAPVSGVSIRDRLLRVRDLTTLVYC